MDVKSFFKLSYGLYVISAQHEGKKSGCIANTLFQVTAEPAQLSITLSKENYTTGLIAASGCFAGTVLTEESPMELIGKFGFKTGAEVDKFSGQAMVIDQNGAPYITDHMAAIYSCKVTQTIDLGTHLMFIGQVTDGKVLSQDPVMTYAYYHTVKNGLTPPKAPSYKADESQSGYRCTVCNYVAQMESLPDDYICPICGKGKNVFVKN